MNEKTANIERNLINQIEACKRRLNEKGYETRERYYDAAKRFCGFLAQEFHSQKFVNIKEKHIKDTSNISKLKDIVQAR